MLNFFRHMWDNIHLVCSGHSFSLEASEHQLLCFLCQIDNKGLRRSLCDRF